MHKPYLYEVQTSGQIQASRAIIMLPDIYGQTDYAIASAKEFATQLARPVFMLDYFYQLTGQPTVISQADGGSAHVLLGKMRGEDFMEIFLQAMVDIAAEYPTLQQLSVIGFCFGGRLAYLAGLNKKVDHIISFYGAGANSDFYMGKSSIAALCEARNDDEKLHVLSFFGSQDQSIPLEDRAKTKAALAQAGIDYQAREYEAGHAYFQPGRPNYNEAAATQSWTDLKAFLQ